ncbi:uncharacterized protein ACHE_60454S [Aspergillus chevalieri]|uniref:Uncharacterized protein n=1 Tax=Aspergillus chevalieri TaxID=182096 RepID=A0A7R7VTK8_ASPCH|nr:uncharacterized protein ACHE_60454S [Aspergillus chevalieri]BCR90567.1 hypothetical protein ACHE_60454S [Aspergillus chevalieri]
MECFRQIGRCLKSPFQRKQVPKGLEIGPPTNFRKEKTPVFFSDDDTLTSHSLGSTMDNDSVMNTIDLPSAREKFRHHVRRMSGRLSRSNDDL